MQVLIDMLYYTFIFPLQSVLGFALDSLHLLTHNYGLSIVILSLLVNLFLLKLAKIAESKATKINALKSVCDKKIAEFKRVFKGAELQSYIRTLYKQKHYHPIFALSALGGLALQVPFFIAVLCLLNEFDGIKGVSFLWIADLSAPDNVLGVHLLPILMTIISLVNVWIVAKDRGAKIQGALISFIFLVLLYQMPSALVLYWTTNMGFSLIRALWSNSLFNNHSADSANRTSNCHTERSEVSQKFTKRDSSPTAQNDKIEKIAESRNDGIRRFFIYRKPLKIAIFSLTTLLIMILLAFGALKLSAPHSAKLTLESIGEAKMHYVLKTFLRSSSMTNKIEITNIVWDSAIDSSAITILSNVQQHIYFYSAKEIDLKQGATLGVAYFTMDNTPFIKNLFIYYFALLGAILCVYLSLCVIAKFQAYSESNARIYRQISTYATLCIAFLICVFTPYQLYDTDITQFDSTQTYSTLSTLFGAFLLISFIVIYALSFVPKRFSHIIAFILSVILFSGIVYSFVLVGDYGAMDRFALQKSPEKSAWQIFEFIAVLSLGIAIMVFALTRLKRALQVILATLFIVSGVNAVQIANKRLALSHTERSEVSQKNKRDSSFASLTQNDNIDSAPPQVANNANIPLAESPLFSYSKNDKNIVVIVLDMFSGSHTTHILEQFPQFKTQLDGFTLYPNAISSSNATPYSMPSIIGGEHYAIYNMNKRKDNHVESEANAYKSIGLSFANAGYNASYLMYAIEARENLLNESKITWIDNTEIFKTHFLEQHPEIAEQLQNKHFDIAKLISFGIFKFAPKIYRTKIYNDGLWLQNERKIDEGAVISHLATFYATTHIGNADSTNPTFKFIHTSMTHAPFGIYFNNGQCEYLSDKTIWENTNPHISSMEYGRYSYQHFDAELCALTYLTHYIQWLKDEGIYDNTQILIVSDHAGDDSINTPKLSPRKIGADVIFLFKDFKERGELKIDSRLMANYDIASIFCENLPNGCPNVPPNILKNYPQNREIIHARPNDDFNRHKPNLWLIDRAYKVKDNIYDPKNWVNISESNDIVNMKQ